MRRSEAAPVAVMLLLVLASCATSSTPDPTTTPTLQTSTTAPPGSSPDPTTTTTTVAPPEPDLVFARTYGGEGADRGVSVVETADGGLVVTGVTASTGAGGDDVYVLRTDALGEEIWSRAYGGTGDDAGWSVVETEDGGFVIAGFTDSFGAGDIDIYLLRTDAAGELIWEQTYGAAGIEYGWALWPASEGGFIIAGETTSEGAGAIDAYLVRVDDEGELIWSETYGGAKDDRVFSVRETLDGGFVAAGITFSSGAGGRDGYVLKVDSSGSQMWETTHGDRGDDVLHSVDETLDGGLVAFGYTDGFEAREYDAYLVQLTEEGSELWSRVLGGDSDDRVIDGQTIDGGFVLAGRSRSFGAGSWDVYVVGTDDVGQVDWTFAHGGSGDQTGYAVHQTAQGGFVITGFAAGPDTASRDLILVRLGG